MKILSEVPWTLKVQCKECKSQLEVEASDVRAVEWESGDCDHTSLYAKCPVCYGELDLDGKVPPGIRDKAVERYRKGKRRR